MRWQFHPNPSISTVSYMYYFTHGASKFCPVFFFFFFFFFGLFPLERLPSPLRYTGRPVIRIRNQNQTTKRTDAKTKTRRKEDGRGEKDVATRTDT